MHLLNLFLNNILISLQPPLSPLAYYDHQSHSSSSSSAQYSLTLPTGYRLCRHCLPRWTRANGSVLQEMSENHCLCLWAGLICRQSLSLHFSVRFASTRCGSLWFCLICLFAVYFRSFLFGFNERLRPAGERVSERQRQQHSGGELQLEKEMEMEREKEERRWGEESTCVERHLQWPWGPLHVCVCAALFDSLHVQQVQSTVLLTLHLPLPLLPLYLSQASLLTRLVVLS